MFNSLINTKYINNNIWTDDNSGNSCYNCRDDFTFLNVVSMRNLKLRLKVKFYKLDLKVFLSLIMQKKKCVIC